MTADITRDFAAARRVTDQCRVLEVERFDQRGQIVGVGVHVVALPRLIRTPVATAVMRDHTIAAFGEEQHLRVPCVRVQRPAV
jgi:hypothetical protein